MADHSEVEPLDAQALNEESDMDEAEPEDEFSDEDDDEDEDGEDDDDNDEENTSLEEGEGSSAEAVAQNSGRLNADELSIKIDFNLGHGMVRIADIRALAPGYVFNLDEEPGAEVSIIAGGKEIGRGEIVQVAERLGVRIVSLKGGSDA